MMRMEPFLRMILHFSHIGFTEDLTFIITSFPHCTQFEYREVQQMLLCAFPNPPDQAAKAALLRDHALGFSLQLLRAGQRQAYASSLPSSRTASRRRQRIAFRGSVNKSPHSSILECGHECKIFFYKLNTPRYIYCNII